MPGVRAKSTTWRISREVLENSLAGASAVTFAGRTVSIMFSLLTAVLLARLLQPAGRGLYALLTLVPTFAVQLLEPGLGTAAVYAVGQRLFPEDRIVSSLLLAVVPLSVAVLIAVGTAQLVGLLKAVGLDGVGVLPILAAASVPFTVATAYLQQVLLGRRQMLHFNTLPVIQAFVQAVAVGCFLVAGYGVGGAVLGTVVANAIAFLVALRFLCKGWPRIKSIDGDFLRFAIGYGLRGYLGRVLPLFSYRLDMFLVGRLLGTYEVGMYSVAVTVAERLLLISSSVATAVFPATASSSPEEAARVASRACRLTLFAMGVAVTAVVMLAQPAVVLLFGASYQASVQALQLLAPGMVALSVADILSSYFAGIGRPEFGIVPSVASVVVNVAANAVLIPRLGINGASLASVAAYTTAASILLVQFRRITGQPVRDILLVSTAELAQLFAGVKQRRFAGCAD